MYPVLIRISLPPPPGGLASAGHVPAVPAVVAARVDPGVQRELPGPERRLQPQHDGERLLRRGWWVLPGAWRHSHRGTARWRGWRRDGDNGSRQEWEQQQQQGRQLGLLSRHHLKPHSQHLFCREIHILGVKDWVQLEEKLSGSGNLLAPERERLVRDSSLKHLVTIIDYKSKAPA